MKLTLKTIVSAVTIFALLAIGSESNFSYAEEATQPALKRATPTATVKFADRDTCSLFLDIYAPSADAPTTLEGKAKPTILWIFGGGFMSGSRNDAVQFWFQKLLDDGYSVVAIDYRLGLKGFKGAGINAKFIKATSKAIDMAVEDLYSATLWLIDNGAEYGIDASNIVLSGSSAGAITSLQAEYDICNAKPLSKMLPEGFNYTGVMAFAGAAYCFDWRLRFNEEPCPLALFHGINDTTVPYKGVELFQLSMCGSSNIVKALNKYGYRNYNIYRFVAHGHEIAVNMGISYPEEIHFLESNVIRGEVRTVDATIDDPTIPFPKWGAGGYKQIYD